jgi:hypothetical protein
LCFCAAGNQRWIAAGGIASIVTSTDGETWSLVNQPVTKYFFHRVRYIKETGLFLAGASFGTILGEWREEEEEEEEEEGELPPP